MPLSFLLSYSMPQGQLICREHGGTDQAGVTSHLGSVKIAADIVSPRNCRTSRMITLKPTK